MRGRRMQSPQDQWVVDMVEPRGSGLGSQEGVAEQDEWRWRADAHRGFVCSERFGGWQRKRVLRQDGEEVFRGTRGSKARARDPSLLQRHCLSLEGLNIAGKAAPGLIKATSSGPASWRRWLAWWWWGVTSSSQFAISFPFSTQSLPSWEASPARADLDSRKP